jgi:hypothetical protein
MRFTRVPLTAALVLGLPLISAAAWPLCDRLTVVVDDGSGQPNSYVLDCATRTGTLPDPGGACDRLAQLGGPAGPAAAGEMCPMIYGGPQTANVTGTWHGGWVDAHYSRANGCEIARWRAMAPVLPTTAGSG